MMHIATQIGERVHAALQQPDTLENVERVANKITYVASGTSVVFGGLSINEWVAIGGFFVALGSALFHAWFKMRYMRPRE